MAEPIVSQSMTPPQALRLARLGWGVLLLLQSLAAGLCVGFLGAAPVNEAAPVSPSLLFLIAVTSLVVLTPVGLFIRNQVYKAHWRGPAVTPRGYLKGNVLLFVLLEAVVLEALVFAMVAGPHPGLLLVAAGSLLVQVVNFPTGRPMQPRSPSLPQPDTL